MRPAVVLDTNAALDWLLFRDPSSARLAAAVTGRTIRWVATAAMRQELTAVLQRGLAAAHDVQASTLLAVWDAYAELHSEPPHLPQGLLARCIDTDDQKFLDLTHAAGARWLVSRDKALLGLTRRAARLGFAIVAPEGWPPVA